jgi:hypothetical protein
LAGIGGSGAGATQVVKGAQAVRRQAALSTIRGNVTGHVLHVDVPALDLSHTPTFVIFANFSVLFSDLPGLGEPALQMPRQSRLVFKLTSVTA